MQWLQLRRALGGFGGTPYLAERRTPAAVSVGDWMWLDGAHVAAQLPQKLAARWYGPYEVVEVLSAGAAVRLDLPAELGRISRVERRRGPRLQVLRRNPSKVSGPLPRPRLVPQSKFKCIPVLPRSGTYFRYDLRYQGPFTLLPL